jgi:hypothetical protein
MAINISISRQRIPMMDASILDDRTRPLEGSDAAATRLRYFGWPSWSGKTDRMPSHQAMPTEARLGRR